MSTRVRSPVVYNCYLAQPSRWNARTMFFMFEGNYLLCVVLFTLSLSLLIAKSTPLRKTRPRLDLHGAFLVLMCCLSVS